MSSYYITITLDLQELSAVNVKGATLKGKIPARCRAVIITSEVISDGENDDVQNKCSAR